MKVAELAVKASMSEVDLTYRLRSIGVLVGADGDVLADDDVIQALSSILERESATRQQRDWRHNHRRRLERATWPRRRMLDR